MDYKPVFTNEQSALVGYTETGNRSVLVIVNTTDNQLTVNLFAPLLVNAGTGFCAQVILEGQDWPLRAPLPLFDQPVRAPPGMVDKNNRAAAQRWWRTVPHETTFEQAQTSIARFADSQDTLDGRPPTKTWAR